MSQSTIKMEKGYYTKLQRYFERILQLSQSTIKMDKGYYIKTNYNMPQIKGKVAIHNKNGKGLLQPYSR